jgi:hypothetical protein
VGVGHNRLCAAVLCIVGDAVAATSALRAFPWRGVSQLTVSLDRCAPPFESRAFGPPWSASLAVGDRQDKDPQSTVGSSNVGSSYRQPRSIIPAFGKPSKYNSSCWKSDDCRDVFNNDPFWPHFANNPEILKPEGGMFSIDDSGLFAGDAEIGAWESANDSSHAATEDVARE